MNKKIREGTVVEINTNPYGVETVWGIEAKVVDPLSVQFTAFYMDGTHTLGYFFYNDEGSSWRIKP